MDVPEDETVTPERERDNDSMRRMDEERNLITMKKFLAILVAVMILAASMSALAAEGDPKISTDSTTHTYQIYQIFTGEKSGDQLVNLKYGQNAATGTTGDSVSATDMAALAAIVEKESNGQYADDQARIADLSGFVTLSNPVAEIGKGKQASAELPVGYYIIKDTDNSLQDPDTYTLYLFKVLDEDLTITPKDGTTTVDKTVTETNDSTPKITTSVKGADYDEGDSIPYSINITLAKNVTDYKTYTVTLTDTLSAGLTPPAKAGITVTLKDKNGTTITGFGAPTVSVSGQAITVTYTVSGVDGAAIGEDGKALNEAVINVSYEAVLNANAVVGVEGNPNTYKIEYSNNPNNTDNGETPEKKVKVFTYDLEIEKKDGNDQPLAGAVFTLYKVVPSDTPNAVQGSEITTTLGTSIQTGKLDANKYYVPVSMTETVGNKKVTHKTDTTIDAGDYVLIETTVPAGYNAYEGMEITITSTIDADGNLTGLTATPSTLSVSAGKKDVVAGTVVNQSGAVLPETGGIGTTIFYIGGSVLVLLAVVLLVTKRRMNAGK